MFCWGCSTTSGIIWCCPLKTLLFSYLLTFRTSITLAKNLKMGIWLMLWFFVYVREMDSCQTSSLENHNRKKNVFLIIYKNKPTHDTLPSSLRKILSPSFTTNAKFGRRITSLSGMCSFLSTKFGSNVATCYASEKFVFRISVSQILLPCSCQALFSLLCSCGAVVLYHGQSQPAEPWAMMFSLLLAWPITMPRLGVKATVSVKHTVARAEPAGEGANG